MVAAGSPSSPTYYAAAMWRAGAIINCAASRSGAITKSGPMLIMCPKQKYNTQYNTVYTIYTTIGSAVGDWVNEA